MTVLRCTPDLRSAQQRHSSGVAGALPGIVLPWANAQVVSSYEELRYWNRLKPGKRFPSALILIDMLPKNARFKDLQMQLIKTARGANAVRARARPCVPVHACAWC